MPLEFNEEEIGSKPAYEKDIRFISPTGTAYGILRKGNLPQFGIDGVSGTVTITGCIGMSDPIEITGSVLVTGSVEVSNTVQVTGSVSVTGSVEISNTVQVTGSVSVTGSVEISNTVQVTGSVDVTGTVAISGTVPTSVARTESNPVIITQAVAVPGTAEAITGTSTLVTQLMIEARRVGGANTGVVYLGTSAVDKTGSQQVTLDPGDNFVFQAVDGQSLDLDSLYVDADTATDGITGWYIGA